MYPSDDDLIEFVYAEAELLDAQRFDQWLELFTEDGYYWMPLTPGQEDARLQASLMYEDRLLLQVRIERLNGQRTFSQQPKSRCHHLLQHPRVLSRDEASGQYVVRCAWHYVEQREEMQTLYAGWSSFHLVQVDGALRMRLKRVDLLNCDAALGSIQLFI